MRVRRLLLLLVCGLVGAGLLAAQDTGSITGTVTDKTGAVIPNAQVVVSNASAGLVRTTSSNSQGDYLVAGLPAGQYDVLTSANGFKKSDVKDVVLRIGQKLRADAALELGATTTEVTVEGTGIGQVETQSSEVAGTVTGKEISQLELNGRNFTQLVTLTPGVSNQTGQDEGTVGVFGNVAFSVNGGRTEYNNWELDGGENMDNGSNATLNTYPSVDAIAEVRVLTSNYGASTAATARAQWRRRPSPAPEVFTATPTSTCATRRLTPATSSTPSGHPTARTISDTRWAGHSSFPGFTTLTRTGPSSFSPRSGGARRTPLPSISRCPRRRSGREIFPTSVRAPTARWTPPPGRRSRTTT